MPTPPLVYQLTKLYHARHRALDAAFVDFGTDLPPTELPLNEQGVTSFAYFDVGSPLTEVVRHEFTAGSPAFQSWLATNDGVALTESYTVALGTLRAGSVVQTEPETGITWTFRLGVYNDKVSTFIYHGTQSDLVALFSKFQFGPSGGTMAPVPGRDAVAVNDYSHAPSIAKPCSTLGLIDVRQLTPEAAKQIPPEGGTATASGSVLYVERSGTEAMTILLVSPTALARIHPNDGLAEAEAIRLASGLEISWIPSEPEVDLR